MNNVIRYFVYLIGGILFLWGVLYLAFVWTPARAVREQAQTTEKVVKGIADTISSVFNLTPERHDRTLSFRVTETNSIYELSTVSRKFTHTYQYSTKWMGSTKNVELVGEYEAKAGIDLSSPLEINVSADGKSVEIHLPRATIHSLTTLDEGAVKEESGYWNRITSQDKELALRALRQDAEKTLEQSDMLRQAEERCYEQIKQRLEAGIRDPGVLIRPVWKTD